MGYETAPATQLLATHCAVCARPLVDAKSVEIGIGPDCRRKHGFDVDVPEESRVEANGLVYRIAAEQDGEGVGAMCDRLRVLGFEVLAARILARVAPVRIIDTGDAIELFAPYRPEAVEALRAVPGRRWNKERKVTVFPLGSRGALWKALQRGYAGLMATGPKGTFVIG
jgi:hypothetical protein